MLAFGILRTDSRHRAGADRPHEKLTTPQESVLARLHATGTFVDVKRYPEADLTPGPLIVRPNGLGPTPWRRGTMDQGSPNRFEHPEGASCVFRDRVGVRF